MREQLKQLRAAMKKHHVDVCYIPTDDFHSSEYVGNYFKARAYFSGFTGSAGTLVVTENWAGLWTDGRYFLQAAQQLKDSGIELCKIAEPGVPTIEEYLTGELSKGMKLAFDGRTVNTRQYQRLKELAEKNEAAIETSLDLAGEIWEDRPALSAEPVFELSAELVGKSRAEKLADVRQKLTDAGADCLVLASLMDICWLMNIRGNDVACTPVVLSFAAITAKDAVLFINPDVLSEEIRGHLEADGVTFQPYESIYRYVKALPSSTTVMMNLSVVNSAIFTAVPANVKILDRRDPTELPKAAKNPTEVENMRKAHIKDGVAVTKLMYWLKHSIGKEPMTELSVAEKLEGFRKEQEGYLEPSFNPIVGWGPHGAIIHYSATEESNVPVQPSSFLLADTGGHYLEGTTDITRTFAMGPLTDEEKKFYTMVLRSHLRLGNVHFRYGCTGMNLDYAAREPFWAENLDYNHGTGHGVGYVLGVHEGPQAFRWRHTENAASAVLEPGMITSDEPGIYLEGKFGVRLENLTVVVEGVTNSYGRFLHLEYLTMVPFDLDAIDLSLMSAEEVRLLNAYHEQVRENLLPYFKGDEAEWLKYATRAV